MTASGRRRKSKSLRFNLSSKEQAGPSWTSLLALCGGTVALCGALLFAFNRSDDASSSPETASSRHAIAQEAVLGQQNYVVQFEKCRRNSIRWTCVVDGDTLWLNGVKIRIADIDTPEVSRPRCQKEYDLGVLATQRLIQLLNQGEFSVATSEWGEQDRFGRKLRFIERAHVSIGDQLVQEGLAHPWVGHKVPWC